MIETPDTSNVSEGSVGLEVIAVVAVEVRVSTEVGVAVAEADGGIN